MNENSLLYSKYIFFSSNNLLADEGTREICKGLSEQIVTPSQPSQPGGLAILVLWNNHLTEEAARHLASALVS